MSEAQEYERMMRQFDPQPGDTWERKSPAQPVRVIVKQVLYRPPRVIYDRVDGMFLHCTWRLSDFRKLYKFVRPGK